MRAIRANASGVPCRFCGAVLAMPHENPWGMCRNCRDKASHWTGRAPLTDENVLQFMSRSLELEIKRQHKYGVTGRCECISAGTSSATSETGGYQCGGTAAFIRDGRRVCGVHSQKSHQRPLYVGEKSMSVYDRYAETLRCICAADEDFRKMVVGVVAECT